MAELQQVTQIPAPPDRPDDAHKGTFGTVIVLGGCETMIGAPAICAASAFRIGAGLVKLAVPRAILAAAITIEPSATGVALHNHVERWPDEIDEADPKREAVLAVGPGMGDTDRTQRAVLDVLRGSRSVVLDADGLNALARTGEPRPKDGPPLVMTPHPGEFKRLAKPLDIHASPTDPDERPDAAAQLARAHDAVVLLKGRNTIVSDGRRFYRNTTGNPALATAGTGDVLTGIIAGLMAQSMSPFDAAALGVHVGGRAADRWAEQHGRAGLTARRLADELPDALHELRSTGRS